MDRKRTRTRVFQDRTNSPEPLPSNVSVSAKPIVHTPMVPTFEQRPPDVYEMEVVGQEKPPAGPPPDRYNHELRRSKRYLTAQEELSESLLRCQQEHSPHELRLVALKKATSILNSHVADAGEQVEKLRELLADRSTEPTLYQSLQRQRWMEERRHFAAEQLSKVLKQHLSTLPSQPGTSPEPSPPNSTSNLKPDANLVRFFEPSSSRQRVLMRNRPRRRVTVASKPRSNKLVDIPRIHHHKHVLPLLLTVPKQRPAFLRDVAKEPVISSVKSEPSPGIANPTPPTSSGLTPAFRNSSLLEAIAEIPGPGPSGRHSTHSGVDINGNGTAIIWRASTRSKEEILAELVVDMPDYVVDLLAGLDSISVTSTPLVPPHEVRSPQLTSSFPSLKPAQSSSSKTTFMSDTQRPQRASGTPSPLYKSPSRKRISTLFSLPEALSSRRGLSTEISRPKRLSTAILEEPTRPVSVSFSALPSSDSGESNEPEADDVLSRWRRRMSALRRH